MDSGLYSLDYEVPTVAGTTATARPAVWRQGDREGNEDMERVQGNEKRGEGGEGRKRTRGTER